MTAIRKPKDFLAGLLFLAIGVGAAAMARDYEIGTAQRMGSGYFPALLGSLLAALAAALMLRSFFGAREPAEGLSARPAVLVLGASLLYAALLRPAGLVVATLVLVCLSALASPRARPLPTLGLAAALALACTAGFVWGLGQPIPVLGDWFGGWAR